jgi:HlyD family secretion protein
MGLKETYAANRKKIWIAGAVCLVVIAGGWYYWRSRTSDVKYVTATVRRGNLTSTVQATGTLNALTTVPVGSYVSGTVQYIFADFNTRVHAGQVLAQLDPAIYEAQVVQARGNLENAEGNLVTLAANVQVDAANVAKSQANVSYQQATAKRSQDLFVSGVVSADSNDLTQSTMVAAQADVQSQQASLEQAKATLAQAKSQVTAMQGALKAAETNLKYTTIVSPIDGTVVARNIDVGQSVAAALQAPNVFTVAQDLTRMQVYAAVDESDTGNIRIGAQATFQVDAFPGDLFRGRVGAVRLNPTTVQNVVTYNCVIDVSNPDEKLLPGETAYITIPTGRAQNAILIPNAAFTYKPEPRTALPDLYRQYSISREASTTHLGGWQVVWEIGADKKPYPLAVQAGITDYANTQMLQGTLNENDVLIVGQTGGAAGGRGAGAAGGRAPGFGPGGR